MLNLAQYNHVWETVTDPVASAGQVIQAGPDTDKRYWNNSAYFFHSPKLITVLILLK